MARKKKGRDFDPAQSLAELVNAMERQLDGGPSAECEAILSQVRDSFGEFERAVTALHAAGQTAAVEIITQDIERCVRRAVRTAADHGAPCAPQTATPGANASATSDTLHSATSGSLIGSQCSNANDGEGQE